MNNLLKVVGIGVGLATLFNKKNSTPPPPPASQADLDAFQNLVVSFLGSPDGQRFLQSAYNIPSASDLALATLSYLVAGPLKSQIEAKTFPLSGDEAYNVILNIVTPLFGTIPAPSSNHVILDQTSTLRLFFLNWLNDYVAYQKSKSPDGTFGDMGYVRTADHFNAFNVVQYLSPDSIQWPIGSGNRISVGNYTNMEAYIKYSWYMSQYGQKPVGTSYGLSDSDLNAVIRAYFTSSDDINNTLGPNGPHSTYLSSLWDHFDIGNVIHWAVEIYKYIGEKLQNTQTNTDGTTTTDPATADDLEPYTDDPGYAA